MIKYSLLIIVVAILNTEIVQAQGSRFSGEWTFNSCTPRRTTCNSFYPTPPQTYIVGDDLSGKLYAVPYSPANLVVTNFLYTDNTITVPGVGPCRGNWANSSVTATCNDGAVLSFTCISGPCKSNTITPSAKLPGSYVQTGNCKSYNSRCADFFDSKYAVSVAEQYLVLTPSNPTEYNTVSLQTYSDGSMMIASSSKICYATSSPLTANLRILCGYPNGAWAEANFQCVGGACSADPIPSAGAILTIKLCTVIAILIVLI